MRVSSAGSSEAGNDGGVNCSVDDCCGVDVEGVGSGMGKEGRNGGRGSCGGERGSACRSWPGRDGDDSGEGERGVKGVSSSGSGVGDDEGGDSGGGTGLDDSECLCSAGDISPAGSLIGWGNAALAVAVLCGLWDESVSGQRCACPSVVCVGLGGWGSVCEAGWWGGAGRRTWARRAVSLRRFLGRARGEKGRPSGSRARRWRLSARSARGVSSFSWSEDEESWSVSGSGVGVGLGYLGRR